MISRILRRKTDQTLLPNVDELANIPEFQDLSYDRRTRSFFYRGAPISTAAITGFRQRGIGPASTRRAVITRWILDSNVRPSRSRTGGRQATGITANTRRLLVGLKDIVYSQQNPGTPLLSAKTSNPAKAAAEAVTSEAAAGEHSAGIRLRPSPAALTFGPI